MDKYIKRLMFVLSARYRVTITTVMHYNDETGTIGNSISLRICNKGSKKAIHEFTTHSKRELVMEMMAWANPQSQ